jgi:hypothetical protein
LVKAEDVTQNVAEQAIKDIKLENNYLVFKDEKHYQDVVEQISKMSNSELENFGKQLNFNSKRRTIDAALNAYASLKENQTLSSEFKKELRFNNDGLYVGTAFPFYNRSVILNNEGIVKVGKELHIFTNEKFIALRDGNADKIEVARRLKSSSDKDNIFISDIHTTTELKSLSDPNQAQLRGTPTPWQNTVVTGNFPVRKAYRAYVNFSWFETGVGPCFPVTTFKNFEFNITAQSLLLIYNSPTANTSETGITLLPVRGAARFNSFSECVVSPTFSYNFYNGIRSNSWTVNATLLSGTMISTGGLVGQFRIEGGFHADSYTNSLYVFNLSDGNWINVN